MTFDELQELARKLDDKTIRESLRGLAEDPRFAALLAVIDRHRKAYVRAISAQNMAPHHGSLAHCAGSLHQVNLLEDTIAALFQKKPGTGMKPPAEHD